VLDPQPLQRPANLRQPAATDRLAGLYGDEVVAAAVGVEAERQALVSNTSRSPQNVEAVPSSSTSNAEYNVLVASSMVTTRSSAGRPASQAARDPSRCSIMPSHGLRSRLRQCGVPRRRTRGTRSAACNFVLTQL
jgi:hypothetical protein